MKFIFMGIALLWIGFCGVVFGLGGVVFGFATSLIVYGIKEALSNR